MSFKLFMKRKLFDIIGLNVKQNTVVRPCIIVTSESNDVHVLYEPATLGINEKFHPVHTCT